MFNKREGGTSFVWTLPLLVRRGGFLIGASILMDSGRKLMEDEEEEEEDEESRRGLLLISSFFFRFSFGPSKMEEGRKKKRFQFFWVFYIKDSIDDIVEGIGRQVDRFVLQLKRSTKKIKTSTS